MTRGSRINRIRRPRRTSTAETDHDRQPRRGGRRRDRVRHPRRNRLLDRLGWYEIAEDAILTTTRQAEALNPALVATHPPLSGPLLGFDLATGQPVTCSPHELYLAGRVSAPNVVILGTIGSGKSSLAKTLYVGRPLAVGVQVVVFDRKRDEHARGEYARAAHVAGRAASVIRFDRHGGAVVNVLDPRISRSSSADDQTGRVGQDELLVMVAEYAHGPLDSYERAALSAAHDAALASARAEGRVATIRDVVDHLFQPSPESVPREHLIETGILTTADLTRWGLALALDLDRFVKGDLSGLIDDQTRGEDGRPLDLTAQLLIIDTSALGEDSPVLALVMAIMASYLSSVWSATPGQRIILIEEGYHTVRLAGVAAVFRSLAKRGRGIGLSVVTVFHHVTDVPAHSDAMSLIREAGIVHVYAQDKADDARLAVELFGLPSTVADDLTALEQGSHILKIGAETPRTVVHARTELEEWITSTDTGMRGVTSAAAGTGPSPFQTEAEQVAAAAATTGAVTTAAAPAAARQEDPGGGQP
jgi:hypothetical protein